MAHELKPCPFCGGQASVQNEDPAMLTGGYFVCCSKCRASSELRFACGDDPVPLLVEAWNKRSEQTVADLRCAKWLDPECADAGACQSLRFKAEQAAQQGANENGRGPEAPPVVDAVDSNPPVVDPVDNNPSGLANPDHITEVWVYDITVHGQRIPDWTTTNRAEAFDKMASNQRRFVPEAQQVEPSDEVMPPLPEPEIGYLTVSGNTGDWIETHNHECGTAAYSAEQMRSYARAVLALKPAAPEGWRLVPVEPTREMILAAWGNEYNDDIPEDADEDDPGTKDCWRRMLAAAPDPMQAEQPRYVRDPVIGGNVAYAARMHREREFARIDGVVSALDRVKREAEQAVPPVQAEQHEQHPDDAAVDRFAEVMIPAKDVVDAVEQFKGLWFKVPAFGNKVNRATREAITAAHGPLFTLLCKAHDAIAMPVRCTSPDDCRAHGCHGACLPADSSPPVQAEQAAQQGEPSDEAIRLADALEQGTYLLSNEREATATELRRLHAAVLALKETRNG